MVLGLNEMAAAELRCESELRIVAGATTSSRSRVRWRAQPSSLGIGSSSIWSADPMHRSTTGFGRPVARRSRSSVVLGPQSYSAPDRCIESVYHCCPGARSRGTTQKSGQHDRVRHESKVSTPPPTRSGTRLRCDQSIMRDSRRPDGGPGRPGRRPMRQRQRRKAPPEGHGKWSIPGHHDLHRSFGSADLEPLEKSCWSRCHGLSRRQARNDPAAVRARDRAVRRVHRRSGEEYGRCRPGSRRFVERSRVSVVYGRSSMASFPDRPMVRSHRC